MTERLQINDSPLAPPNVIPKFQPKSRFQALLLIIQVSDIKNQNELVKLISHLNMKSQHQMSYF